MARQPRLTIASYPHHVIVRGNNRQPIWVDDEDADVLLELLQTHASAYRVSVHSYVLMSNHLHLLATPDDASGLAALMQAVGRRYVPRFNRRHGRSGALFEGRYRSGLLQAERHLLACMAYFDLNPVRAGMVHAPQHYSWSSHQHYVGQRTDALITPHAMYWQLGNTPFAREQAYAALVAAGVAEPVRQALGISGHTGWPLGEANFIAQLQQRLDRRVTKFNVGRPRRATPKPQPEIHAVSAVVKMKDGI